MPAATITSKGQITIPKDIRVLLDLRTGDKINFIVNDEGAVNLVPVTQKITTLKGIVSKPNKPVSVDDMNATVKTRRGRF